jgi:hypothetical protein
MPACDAGAMQDAAGVTALPAEAAADRIRLILPAQPQYGRIARVAASSLALRLELPFPEIEDLRIAVDETVILLLRPEGGPGEIALDFTIEPGRLTIEAWTTAGAGQFWVDAGALRRFEQLVDSTVDECVVDSQNQHVRLVKLY